MGLVSSYEETGGTKDLQGSATILCDTTLVDTCHLFKPLNCTTRRVSPKSLVNLSAGRLINCSQMCHSGEGC